MNTEIKLTTERTVVGNMPSVLLVGLPLTDPTAPYHSLPYVAGAAMAAGYSDIMGVDTNIEALWYFARPEEQKMLLDECQVTMDRLMAAENLDELNQLKLQICLQSLPLRDQSIADLLRFMQTEDAVEDYARYRRAGRIIQNWIEVLTVRGFPYSFTRTFGIRNVGAFDYTLVESLVDSSVIDRFVAPLSRYFQMEFFPLIGEKRPDVIGLNITYVAQLPFALWLGREIRRLFPSIVLLVGGTEVSDVYKCSVRCDFSRLFEHFDACVVGEGESAFKRLLEWCSEARRDDDADIANVFWPGRVGKQAVEIEYEDVQVSARPFYDLFDASRYLSPFRVVYYSPSRGCYWNKCTFCDYGLNFGTPTSPWRARHIAEIVRDIQEIGSKFVYFSVDVLAPGALVRLAREIVRQQIDVRWSAEIRLERFFSYEACVELRDSGCVAVSFGFESGSQHILDLLSKGTKVRDVPDLMRNFTKAGIAVQMMGFTGFPGESAEDAFATFDLLEEYRGYWTVASIGEFMLTPGAIVAKNPAAFNIVITDGVEPGRIVRVLSHSGALELSETERTAVEGRKRALRTVEFDRPFAGGIDSAHSMIFYDRYGTEFPAIVAQSIARRKELGEAVRLDGVLVDNVPFAIHELVTPRDLDERRSKVGHGGGSISKIGQLNPCAVRWDGAIVPCDQTLFAYLGDGAAIGIRGEMERQSGRAASNETSVNIDLAVGETIARRLGLVSSDRLL